MVGSNFDLLPPERIFLPQSKIGSGPGIPSSPADPYADRFLEKNINTDKCATPPTSITSRTAAANITPPSTTAPAASKPVSESPIPLLKRNISISKDGKMAYSETKPLGKVHGSEFIAVEKADPSVIPYLMDKDGMAQPVPPLPQSLGVARSQSPLPQQSLTSSSNNASTRQQEEYNALRMAAKLQQRAPSSELERGTGAPSAAASSVVSEETTQPQRNSEIIVYDNSIKEEDAILSDDEGEDEFFYAM
ncbi:6092_t:CDS:2 [Acaulospora colombiana]|uniref:6092_t:CDS:1 n=1 Tax=Acaulospora colombiana TaxID=27376 RepID=A0ACA9LVV7_9GLOM|nr:6092_t:CDS:2 [Acaulospora colombiana]